VKNVSLTLLNREKNRAAASIDEYEENLEDGFNLEEETLAKLDAEQVYGLLDSLNEDIKAVFILKYAYDLPHREIGKLLGISENNVTVRFHRAKKKLGEQLGKGAKTGA
jgi:RNA polymerase sigma-70 factor (ECF subfamily)